jgi:hypothetical protein
MGAIVSKTKPQNKSYFRPAGTDSQPWRLNETSVSMLKDIKIDPTLPSLTDHDHIQLYQLLHEPVAQTLLSKHAVSVERVGLLLCWVEIEEFKQENVAKLRLVRAKEIIENFVVSGARHPLLSTSLAEVARYEDILVAYSAPGSCPIPDSAFAEVFLFD